MIKAYTPPNSFSEYFLPYNNNNVLASYGAKYIEDVLKCFKFISLTGFRLTRTQCMQHKLQSLVSISSKRHFTDARDKTQWLSHPTRYQFNTGVEGGKRGWISCQMTLEPGWDSNSQSLNESQVNEKLYHDTSVCKVASSSLPPSYFFLWDTFIIAYSDSDLPDDQVQFPSCWPPIGHLGRQAKLVRLSVTVKEN